MARDFLVDTQLPKRFLYWATREAARRVYILPVSSNSDNPTNPASMTTPYFEFYGTKPVYRTFFIFGAIDSF